MKLHTALSMYRAWLRGTKHKIKIELVYNSVANKYSKSYMLIKCTRCGFNYSYIHTYPQHKNEPSVLYREFLSILFEEKTFWCDDVIIQRIHNL